MYGSFLLPKPFTYRIGLATKLFTLNPKATTVVELYGVLDPITWDWTDGLLSNIFREVNKPTDKNERKYILFDGDVDTLWVESMNSVMDDNKLLTLANGERIRLQKHCALLVEVGQCGVWLHPLSVSDVRRNVGIFKFTHFTMLMYNLCSQHTGSSHLVCIEWALSHVFSLYILHCILWYKQYVICKVWLNGHQYISVVLNGPYRLVTFSMPVPQQCLDVAWCMWIQRTWATCPTGSAG